MTETITTVHRLRQPPSLVAKLQAEAAKSPVFNAMSHVFAMRERTRRQITIHSLFSSMKKEGYTFTKNEYRDALTFMADQGLGSLQRSSRGTVVALKDITYTLQSIGLASVSRTGHLNKSIVKERYKRIPVPTKEKAVIIDNVLKKPLKETTLIVKLGYKTFNFDLFPENKIKDVLDLIDKVYTEKVKRSGGANG